MNRPLVSVITISYNSEETIEDTIKSVVNQDYANLEYIIIDGASKDRTLEIIEKYKDRISLVVSEPDKGIYDAMNKGVQYAKGDLIGILNSDDVYADDRVLTDIVDRIGNKQAIYADLVYVKRDSLDEVVRYWRSGVYDKSRFMKGWMPPHPTFFLQKACYDQFGVYNTELKSAADYELMLRMLFKNNVSCAYLNRVITRMRVGGQSNVSLKNRLAANREDRYAWELNGLKPGRLTLIRKPLSKIKQWIIKG